MRLNALLKIKQHVSNRAEIQTQVVKKPHSGPPPSSLPKPPSVFLWKCYTLRKGGGNHNTLLIKN